MPDLPITYDRWRHADEPDWRNTRLSRRADADLEFDREADWSLRDREAVGPDDEEPDPDTDDVVLKKGRQ